jgi:hypothetical protein
LKERPFFDARHHRADADHHAGVKLGGQGIHNRTASFSRSRDSMPGVFL